MNSINHTEIKRTVADAFEKEYGVRPTYKSIVLLEGNGNAWEYTLFEIGKYTYELRNGEVVNYTMKHEAEESALYWFRLYIEAKEELERAETTLMSR